MARSDFCIWRFTPMFCPNCGKDNLPGAVFCIDCGARLQPPPPPPPPPLMELVARIPVVNLIFFCIWSFQTDVNPNKKNWARSRLIWMGISLGLSILAAMVGIGIFSALIAGFRGAA